MWWFHRSETHVLVAWVFLGFDMDIDIPNGALFFIILRILSGLIRSSSTDWSASGIKCQVPNQEKTSCQHMKNWPTNIDESSSLQWLCRDSLTQRYTRSSEKTISPREHLHVFVCLKNVSGGKQLIINLNFNKPGSRSFHSPLLLRKETAMNIPGAGALSGAQLLGKPGMGRLILVYLCTMDHYGGYMSSAKQEYDNDLFFFAKYPRLAMSSNTVWWLSKNSTTNWLCFGSLIVQVKFYHKHVSL